MNSQVGDVLKTNSKFYSQKTYNSLKPINWLLDFFAINNNIGNTPCSEAFYMSKCFLAITILGSLNIFSLYYKNNYLYEKITIIQSVRLTETVQMIYDIIQYLVDLWFVYTRRHITLEYFEQYECLDKILGMNSYLKMKWKLIRLVTTFTVIWLVSCSCDFAAWTLSYGWEIPSVYAIAYLFLYIKILTTLDLSSHVMHIESRLVIITEIVQHYYYSTEPLPGFTGYYELKKSWFEEKSTAPSQATQHRSKLESTDECSKLTLLTRCYLLLTEQAEFINRIFGVRILLNSLSLLIDIIRFTNIAVRTVLGSLVIAHESRYILATTNMMRQMTCILVLISLVYHCEKVYRQRDSIISTIDRLLIYRNPSDKLRTAMNELRGIMQARPISFNLANFFRLDNSFLISIASTVVTYTIILLQSMN